MKALLFIFIVKSVVLIGNLSLNSCPHCPDEKNIMIKKETIASRYLNRRVTIDLYVYKGSPLSTSGYRWLIFNDGQDLDRMRFDTIPGNSRNGISKQNILVAGVYPQERLNEYGTSSSADYMGRGRDASLYAQFIAYELIPYLRSRYPLEGRAGIAGFSLGGLSAFDIALREPLLFDKVGVFSGSFWWRSEAFMPMEPDANRIVIEYLKGYKPGSMSQKFWFQTGERDEESDRNNNGIIDSIDDTLDVIAGLEKAGIAPACIRYVEVRGGSHSVETWAAIMPEFLRWWLQE